MSTVLHDRGEYGWILDFLLVFKLPWVIIESLNNELVLCSLRLCHSTQSSGGEDPNAIVGEVRRKAGRDSGCENERRALFKADKFKNNKNLQKFQNTKSHKSNSKSKRETQMVQTVKTSRNRHGDREVTQTT